jgi:ubiquinone/menaquinone biosynthesis C-methylase UbiE
MVVGLSVYDMTYYDEISEGYDELHEAEQLRKAEVILGEMHPKESELLLDVGCGPASYFPYFRCAKIGLDPSIELLKQAEDGFFVQGVGEALPFMDKCFDYVISVTAIHNFDDVEKGLLEMKRVAKKEVAISVLRASKKAELIEKLLTKMFKIKKMVLEEKDIIFFLEAD